MIIYEIDNKITNKPLYVGKYSKCDSTEEFQKSKYWGSGKIIKNVINRYGTENLEKRVLERGIRNLEEIKEREEFWIKEKNTLYPNGYNLTDKSSGGDTFTNNPNKERIRKEKKDFYQTLEGKKQAKEHSLKMKGKKRPEITGPNHPNFGKVGYWAGKKRPDISERIRNKNHPFFGKKRPDISERMIGPKNFNWGKGYLIKGSKNPRAREVVLISPEGVLHLMKSYKDFCLKHNLNPEHICEVLQKKKNNHKGWTGYYMDKK